MRVYIIEDEGEFWDLNPCRVYSSERKAKKYLNERYIRISKWMWKDDLGWGHQIRECDVL